MTNSYRSITQVCSFILAAGLLAGGVQAGSMAQLGSGVQAYFGSQGTGYQASNPLVAFTPPGSAPLYPTGAVLPNLPAMPVPPAFTYPSAVSYQVGGGSTSVFNDLLPPSANTTATSIIADSYNPAPTLTSDASVVIPSWTLTQGPAAASYAYEQLNFAADYGVVGVVLGGATPNFPLTISGVVVGGSTDYAQFDATLQYTWYPSTSTSFVPNGPAVPLGTLTYSWNQVGGGTFGTTLFSSGNLSAAPTNWGLLEISGYMWVAGDPYSISVSSVPEPSALALLALGGTVLLHRRRRVPAPV
jgi:hypothetical protein